MRVTPVGGEGQDALAKVLAVLPSHAPYLARLMRQRPDALATLSTRGVDASVEAAIAAARHSAELGAFSEAMAGLRRAKADLHLALGVADLAGLADYACVASGLSRFADAALCGALAMAERHMLEAGDLGAPVRGYCLVAMGKLGARELNYSSDVDLIALYAPNWLSPSPRMDARTAAVRLTQHWVRAMHEVTADGYVFRIDLRLRPDPASTPVAVTFAAAERYYQSVGENWERAAFIKARVCAGDIEMGEAFLSTLRPFIWRRHLDYAAIDDIRAIQRQIHRYHGSAPLDQAAFDVKLGRGGIRDIELFVQAQQLILGGRAAQLRAPATLDALRLLSEYGAIPAEKAARLAQAYTLWRSVEHRIQMRHDEHTHTLASDPSERACIALLCGYDSLAAFDADIIALRADVASLCDGMQEVVRRAPGGQVGAVDVDALIADVGFRDVAQVRATIETWRAGAARALRTPRARALLEACLPGVLATCADQAGPDETFAVFADFVERLRSGVQVFALIEARPDILAALATLFSVAPRLAVDLAQRQTLIDSIGESRFMAAISGEAPGGRLRILQSVTAAENTFEASMNAARRYQREEMFRITAQLLRRTASARAAGQAYTDLANACVCAMADAAVMDVEGRFGRQPGRSCVLALGKFAGDELSAHSDLDVMLIYDAPDGARSSGERALSAGDFYARLAQRIIAGLSAPTEEGQLYDIDMQLRPSGSKGPVAVRLSSFARYYREEAWTWELQALSRARVVWGELGLGEAVMDAVREGLSAPRDADTLRADVATMRGRMDREKPPRGVFDLKLAPGGLIDIEFITQGLLLTAGAMHKAAPIPSTANALQALARAGVLAGDDEAMLRQAFDLYSDLQQILRAAAVEPWEPAAAAPGLKALLCAAADVADVSGLVARVATTQASVRGAFVRIIGDPTTV